MVAWDSGAKRLAMKAIGTVESDLRYDAINYNDPITVGFMQWFGFRAANLLKRIRSENASSWVGVQGDINADLNAHPTTGGGVSWWSGRTLSQPEGESLRPILAANVAIQQDQFYDDLVPYEQVAKSQGIDPDVNTEQFIFWCAIYHQSPKRAEQIKKVTPADASLEKWLANTLNNERMKDYPTRYRTVYAIIKSGDTSGIPESQTPTTNEWEVVGDDAGMLDDHNNPLTDERPEGRVGYVQLVSPSHIVIHMRDGNPMHGYWDGTSSWVVGEDFGQGYAVPDNVMSEWTPPPGPTPTFPTAPEPDPVPPSSDVAARRAAVVKWLTDRVGRFIYGQNAKRLDPDRTGSSDCSGVAWAAYNSIGVNINPGSTRTQVTKGVRVKSGSGPFRDTSGMFAGDLVFYALGGGTRVTHVEVYMGDGRVIGHGGPGKGPTIKNVSTSFNSCTYHEVRRHLT